MPWDSGYPAGWAFYSPPKPHRFRSRPPPALASVPAISGRVLDAESGAPLAEVVVAVTDLDRATLTDAEGHYTLEAVPPGPQHVVVRRLGYSSETFHALVPRQGTLDDRHRAPPGADRARRHRDDRSPRAHSATWLRCRRWPRLSGSSASPSPPSAMIRCPPSRMSSRPPAGPRSSCVPRPRAGSTSAADPRTTWPISSTTSRCSAPITPPAPSAPGTRMRSPSSIS